MSLNADRRLRSNGKPLWLPAIALTLALAVFAGLDRELADWSNQYSALSTQYSIMREHRVEYDLRRCSPAHVELSPVVYFAIRSAADGEPEIIGCTRHAMIPPPRAGSQAR